MSIIDYNGVECKTIRYERVINGQIHPTTAVLIVPRTYTGGVCWIDNDVSFLNEYGCDDFTESIAECYAQTELPATVREIEAIQARVWLICGVDPKTFVPTSAATPEIPPCTCSSLDLFNFGCRCPHSKKP